MRLRRALNPVVVPAVLLVLWEVSARGSGTILDLFVLAGVPRASLPDLSFFLPASRVFPHFVALFTEGEIAPYLFDTTWLTLVSFLISGVVGVIIGIPIGLSLRLERILYPTVDALRSIPPIALLPLMILFFGIEERMKILFISFGAIWPVVVSAAAALKGIETLWVKVALNCGHSRWYIFVHVMLPAALPQIFPGLRISLSISLILSIVCEMLTGNSGLGHFLNYCKRNFEFGNMFATIIIIALLGWVLNAVFAFYDRKILKWHYLRTGKLT